VTVSEAVAQGFAGEMTRLGFGQGTTCDPNYDNPFNASGRCIAATLNGNVTFMGGVRPDLGSSFSDGSFAEDPTFTMSTTSIEEAREVEISLKSGRLPAPLDFRNDRSTSLEPALAEQFRSNSVIVGLAAVLAVSLVVYVRYGDPRVAAPMIVTALSEVFLLLGFVAFVQYPLNLSHIAGFIAVIGTGVDDLVIIADEILQREDVTTGRVFQSRFRKAFWVIGAAAATTVLAMSPLTVLALGDLSGFAVVTIVGVLIGVLITRPAYGNILRNLILDE
jgi:preprotein translocase subunit SecD